MKTTLKKLSIPKPKGGFDDLYMDDFVTEDKLFEKIKDFRNLIYKLHFEKDEVTDIHPFYIKSLEDENVIYDSTVTCRLSTHADDVEYSYGDSWISLSDVETITLNKGERVYFRYVGENYLSGVAEAEQLLAEQSRLTTTTKTFDVGGDIRTLMFGNTTEESVPERGMQSLFIGLKVVDASKLLLKSTTLASGCYAGMFLGCAYLTQAPELPATTLTTQCYYSMFYSCTGLTQAPELPATTLASSCYSNMFLGCTALTQAPELPATTMASNCYHYMFSHCTGLTQAPELPATTMADDCYSFMFYYCTGLTQAPELPATTLAERCYRSMFDGCSNLNYIKCLATDISTTDCTTNWVFCVASTGTFVKSSGVDWTTGESGIPSGWTVEEI